MNKAELRSFVQALMDLVSERIPLYMEDSQDECISNGNVAICIIDDDFNVYGRMFGQDKVKSRRSLNLAWQKATQTWMTGMKTGEFEQRIFNNEIDEGDYGIGMPDMIGWEGGQPVALKDGTILFVGFSGFRGINDLDIVAKSVVELEAVLSGLS